MQIDSPNARKRILIISADRFEDSELLQPYQQLSEEGIAIDIASLKQGLITGKHGSEVITDLSVEEVEPSNYDMLLLPGGRAPTELRKHQRVLDITRDFFENNKPVAAICHGPQILISAGVMQGRTATSTSSVSNELKEAGSNYQDKEVVVDGKLITSRRPDDIPAFVREILIALHKDNPEKRRS